MALLYFAYLDSQGETQECSYGSQHLNDCFNALSALAGAGGQLIWARLLVNARSSIALPVEAFDGESMLEPLQRLQQEWEEILIQ